MAGWHRINVADLTRRDLLEYRKWLIDDVKMDPDARSERRYGQWRALTARQPCPARFSILVTLWRWDMQRKSHGEGSSARELIRAVTI